MTLISTHAAPNPDSSLSPAEEHDLCPSGAPIEEAFDSSEQIVHFTRVQTLMQMCNKCRQPKPLSHFYRKRAGWDTRCKQCLTAYNKERFDKMNEVRRAKSKSLQDRGICVGCAKNPIRVDESKSFCSDCLAYRRSNDKRYRSKVRNALFEQYGGRVCNCCGETEDKFLSFDHINEDGAEQRRLIGANGSSDGTLGTLYRHLKHAGFPLTIQVLCHNCNMGKHLNGGTCPHEEGD